MGTAAKPKFVTFTGADDGTAPSEMLALGRDYPVEFAILFSGGRAGTGRYPSMKWVSSLLEEETPALAVHLCGELAKSAGRGEQLPDGWHELLMSPKIGRVQINLSAPPPLGTVKEWATKYAVTPIVQCRGPFPQDDRVQWLYDPSGGTGKRPDMWPKQESDDHIVGYAGGIGPDNVTETLEAIPSAVNYWIDMESSLRDSDDRFDLKACRRVCEAVFGTRQEVESHPDHLVLRP